MDIGPVGSVLVKYTGQRFTMFLGGCLLVVGALSSAFANSIVIVILCCGFIMGNLLVFFTGLSHSGAIMGAWSLPKGYSHRLRRVIS